MALIRKFRQAELRVILAIINDAAQVYRGVIPADRWRDPYMPPEELEQEIAESVIFWVAEEEGGVAGGDGDSGQRRSRSGTPRLH